MKKNVTIIGAGLVGSLLAIYLVRRGYKVKVFERRGDMRRSDMIGGRSINLALSDRGIRALEEVGIMEEIRKICIPMHGRYIHNADGSNAFQVYGKEGQFINSVSRGDLNRKLMHLAEASGAELNFHHNCKQIDWKERCIEFENRDAESVLVNFQVLFGSDGAYSAARLQHQLHHDRFQYDQYYIDFGYKELTISPAEDGSFRMEKNALHIWPRGNYMLIALPNIDGSFTCTLFFPFEGDPSFATLTDADKLNHFFKNNFADALELMPTLAKDFFNNPTSSLVTIRCFPWVREDHFALIGDAAHAIVPFFGQGMNCGFEDCAVLDGLINKHDHDWKNILSEYQSLRKPDGDAIAELALNNFVEMRDKVADTRFLQQKKIEARLHQLSPDKWIPAYSQVTFSPGIRYSEALNRGKKQDAIMQPFMNEVMKGANWDNDDFLQRILVMV